MQPLRPPFDPELAASLMVVGGVFPPTITPELIGFMRRSYASQDIEQELRGRRIARHEHSIPGHGGDPIEMTRFVPERANGARPAILYAHSGGLMFGDRFSGIAPCLDWVEQLGVQLITVEYRLAPEHRDPYAREDLYAALEWLRRETGTLQIDPHRIVVAGASAGGGLAAGLALAARDRDGPALAAQLLIYPMLDDRGEAASTRQFDGVGVWDRVSNETGWRAYLGERYRAQGSEVSAYAVPARATDLRGLPATYLDVGSSEIFRDEVVDYASRLWQAGGDCELHVWPGGFHAFDIFASHTALARGMIAARDDWLRRRIAD